jgi:fructose-1,6-bisphosphatase/inositol monophosphatase family enzyme
VSKILRADLPLPNRYGSAVYAAALLATGRADAAVYVNQGLWDIAMLPLIAKVSELKLTWLTSILDLNHLPNEEFSHSLIVGQPEWHDKLLKSMG